MGMSEKKLPYQFICSTASNKFKYGISLGFPVVVYTYETPGIATNWVILFKVTQGNHTDHFDVIRCMCDAAKNDPIFLLRRETKYCINLIRLATGKINFKKKSQRPFFPTFLKMNPLLSSAILTQRNILWNMLLVNILRWWVSEQWRLKYPRRHLCPKFTR